MNHVSLLGRLTRDVGVEYTPNGMAIGKFTLAVDNSVKKGGEWVKESYFFDCVLFGKQAEALKPYLLKGKQVAIGGKLKQDKWEKDGQKHTKVSISVENIDLCGDKGGNSNAPAPKQETTNNAPTQVQVVADAFDGDFSEGIPF